MQQQLHNVKGLSVPFACGHEEYKAAEENVHFRLAVT